MLKALKNILFFGGSVTAGAGLWVSTLEIRYPVGEVKPDWTPLLLMLVGLAMAGVGAIASLSEPTSGNMPGKDKDVIS